MPRTYLRDNRGWDCDDPFTLPIIAAIDTLERDGIIQQNISCRKKFGEVSLALSANLNYYSFLLIPAVNKARVMLISDANGPDIIVNDNRYLGLTYYVEALFKELITIDELIKQFVLEIMNYLGILNQYSSISDPAIRRNKQYEDATNLILKVLANKHVTTKQWYLFVNKLRNFVTHEGVFTIDYVEDQNVYFYKKHWDRRLKINMRMITKKINKFITIREALRSGLSDVDFWKDDIANI